MVHEENIQKLHPFYRKTAFRLLDNVWSYIRAIYVVDESLHTSTVPYKKLKIWVECRDGLTQRDLSRLRGKKSREVEVVSQYADKMPIFVNDAPEGQSYLEEKYEAIEEEVDGSYPKYWITLFGKRFLLKLEKHRDHHSVYSEHVASRLFRALGLPAHKTLLSTFHGEVCVLCEDCVLTNYEMRTFSDIHQSSVESGFSLDDLSYTFADVESEIAALRYSQLEKDNILTNFWRMWVCDAIVANRDRHGGNWGYLVSNNSSLVLPVYDNGASLFPDYLDKEIAGKDRLREHTVDQPASVIRKQSNMSESFYTMSLQISDRRGLHALNWAREKNIVNCIRAACLSIPEPIAAYYRRVIYLRFNVIVLGRDFEDCYKEMIEIGY